MGTSVCWYGEVCCVPCCNSVAGIRRGENIFVIKIVGVTV